MRGRLVGSLGTIAVALTGLSYTSEPVAGQVAPATKAWAQPRTPWGDPDLQGIWNNGTVTPLERPAALGGRQFLTDEERAALNEDAQTRDDRPPRPGDVGFYNAIWWDRGPALARTALIIDPPDGAIPPLTPEAQKRRAARADARRGRGQADSWEDRSLWERCIIYRPLPRVPTNYNNNYEIVQAPGYVTILQEEIHEVRIVPLDGRSHVGSGIRQYLGDARGRWDGNTLVIETTNFTDKTDFYGAGSNLHAIERLTRVAEDRIEYQFTVTDPTTWTRPWTAAWPMLRTDGPIYEYACHEGNYGLENILSGARAEEGSPR